MRKTVLLRCFHLVLAGAFCLSPPFLSRSAAGLSTETAAQASLKTPDGSTLQFRSHEEKGSITAEIRGTIDYPFSQLSGALTNPSSWCEFLPLVFNIKSCVQESRGDQDLLTLYVGRKFFETPEEAMQIEYVFRVQEQSKNRLRMLLFAPRGPHGTRDYRIEVEANADPQGRTWLRLNSSFRPSLRSDMATRAYLATSGREKIGFSIRGYEGTKPVYVNGTRGIIERNVMRYYLALKSFLDTLHLPEKERLEARLHTWYRLTEHYPRQLHEMDKETYLKAKRQERRNQAELQQRIDRLQAGKKQLAPGAAAG